MADDDLYICLIFQCVRVITIGGIICYTNNSDDELMEFSST